MNKIIAFALSIVVLVSCSTSNEVATNSLLQKRKYKKGWHINSLSKLPHTNDSDKTKEIDFDSKIVNSEKNKDTFRPVVLPENLKTSKEKRNGIEVIVKQIDSKEFDKKGISQIEKVRNIMPGISDKLRNNQFKTFPAGNVIQDTNSFSDDDLLFILLLIVCFLIPPITVAFVAGLESRDFLISLILFLSAAVFLNVLVLIGFLAGILAVLHALFVLFEII